MPTGLVLTAGGCPFTLTEALHFEEVPFRLPDMSGESKAWMVGAVGVESTLSHQN